MIHRVVKEMWACNVCGREWALPAEAEACAARGLAVEIVKPGDIVFLSAGYGWYDGDATWVSNPKVKLKLDGAKCPNGNKSCYSHCCTFRFYYVITAVDRDPEDGHRARYHVETRAMTGKQGHHGGYTYEVHHVRPKLVVDPPDAVVKAGAKLVGHVFRNLF